jgi:hypothetical protein
MSKSDQEYRHDRHAGFNLFSKSYGDFERGICIEKATKIIEGRHSEIFGDILFPSFEGEPLLDAVNDRTPGSNCLANRCTFTEIKPIR